MAQPLPALSASEFREMVILKVKALRGTATAEEAARAAALNIQRIRAADAGRV